MRNASSGWRTRRFRAADIEAARAELQAGRHDSARARWLYSAAGPLALLERAAATLERGDIGPARRDIRAALTQAQGVGLVRAIGGLLLFCARDYHGALATLRQAIDESPGSSARFVVELARQRAGRIGWNHEELELLERGLRIQHRVGWLQRAAEIHAECQNWERAASYLERAMPMLPDRTQRTPLAIRLVDYHVRQGQAHRAMKAYERWIGLEDLTGAQLLQLIRSAIDAGRFDEVEKSFPLLIKAPPPEIAQKMQWGVVPTDDDRALALAERARLNVWAGWDEGALADADKITAGPALPRAHAIRGIVAARAGRLDEAAEWLDRSLELDGGDVGALTWRAWVAMHKGQFDAAVEFNERAMICAEGFPLPSRLMQLRIRLAAGDPQPVWTPDRFDEQRVGLLELCPEAEPWIATGDHGEITKALDLALERLVGNFSDTPTHLTEPPGKLAELGYGKRLTRLKTRAGPRFAARGLQLLIQCESIDRVLELYEPLLTRFEHSSLPLAHRGELLMWLGDYEGARADLNRAIERNDQTRWAYIGLVGILNCEGKPEEAMAMAERGVRVMHNTTGPAMYGYRGESLRMLGRLEEAIVDLEEALVQRPNRVGARVNLALARAALGQHDAQAAIFATLLESVPGLMSDAAREADVDLYAPDPAALDTAARTAVLERALVMLRGNRGSTIITYFTREGVLRLAPVLRPGSGRGPDRLAEDLRQIRGLLDRAYGIAGPVKRPTRGAEPRSRPAPTQASSTSKTASAPPPRHTPTLLTADELEQFITRGHVIVRDCFSREVAREWVADALARMTGEPERWVKRYFAGDKDRDLTGFRADDRATWTWPRLDLMGDRNIPLGEFSPRAWQAVCDLLGGAARVKTTQISTYFSINFCDRHDVPWAPPPPEAESWHFDDPSTKTTLDTYRHGLIVFFYFSDILPQSGATFIAPESVGIAARQLAAHPEGVDWRARPSGVAVTRQCSEFVELTGRVGDVILCHPFMVHSSSANPSGRIRYMNNTVIDLREPLVIDRPDPADHSPVERAVRRALGRE